MTQTGGTQGHDEFELPAWVGKSPEDKGPGYYYRKHQLLVPDQDDNVERVEEQLRRFNFGYDVKERVANGALILVELHDPLAVPEAIAKIQEATRDDHLRAEPIVAPNHVLFGASHPTALPSGPPRPSSTFSLEDPTPPGGNLPGRGITVAVLDSGIIGRHLWFDAAGSVEFDTGPDGDVEWPVADGQPLPPYAGHGTHISGVIRRHAPGAKVLVRKVFGGDGAVDDLTLECKLRALPSDVHIVCLALGGGAQGDQTLPATASVLRDWSSDPVLSRRVVVASAGNDGVKRPMWPAAFKRVVAVAALGLHGDRARFSNYGWWVDACSTGVDVDSAFFTFSGPIEAVRHDASPPGAAVGQVEKFHGFAQWDGTSFAAPRVAAAVACAMSLGVDGPEAVHLLLNGPSVVRLPDLGARIEPPAFF